MRVVVTGAAGFLGSHVADVLAAAGHDVTTFDVAPDARHRGIVGDLLDEAAVREALRGADVVCHLAAIGDVYLAGERPALAASVNAAGTANVCEAALAEGVRRVVVASTWEVYGRPRYEPLDEAHPCDPDHPYSITKLAGERLAISYHHLRELEVVALRLGTAYGLRMRSNSVFSAFIGQAQAGKPITIHGSGGQARQFTHASDIGRAFEAALDRGGVGATYNVVGDEMISIKQLAEMVTEALPTQVVYGAPRPGDVPSARVSNEKAKAELGWRPRVSFREGLRELIDTTAVARSGAPR